MPRPKTDSWDDVAAFLCVNIRQVHNMRHEIGAPLGKDRDEWDQFMKRRKGETQTENKDLGDEDLPGKNPYDTPNKNGRMPYKVALLREQVSEQLKINEKREIELAQMRGDLLTREQVESRDELMDEIYMTHLARCVEFVGTLVPPEQGNAVRDKADAWVADARAKIATDIETIGK